MTPESPAPSASAPAEATAAPLRVGIAGFGTVGQGVARLLARNADDLARRAGRPLRLTRVATRTPSKGAEFLPPGVVADQDPLALAGDPAVDVVVELMGGLDAAEAVVRAALAAGKTVVTANKALLAERGDGLFARAAEAGVALHYEASVAGGIPIIKALREGLAANRVEALAGIINGTCNYILTQMTVKGQAFAEALADAQRLGYAEADPTFDVEGVDAAHKLTVLASIAFGVPLDFAAVGTEGITRVGPEDIRTAATLGYRIKLLGLAKRSARGIELRVQPTLVPDDHLIAKVDGVLNAVVVRGDTVGEVGFTGRGAGGDATASAVVADLIDAARDLGRPPRLPGLGFTGGATALPVIPLAEVVSSHYLRLNVADQPGVLTALTGALAGHGISIEAILQKEPRAGDDATVSVITNAVPEAAFDAALADIERLPAVRGRAARLRVERFT